MDGAPHLAAMADREEVLRTLVGAAHVRPIESPQPGQTRLFVEPGDAREISAVLKFANSSGLSVIPQGGTTKSSWGNPAERNDLLLSTVRLNKVVEHASADLTVT